MQYNLNNSQIASLVVFTDSFVACVFQYKLYLQDVVCVKIWTKYFTESTIQFLLSLSLSLSLFFKLIQKFDLLITKRKNSRGYKTLQSGPSSVWNFHLCLDKPNGGEGGGGEKREENWNKLDVSTIRNLKIHRRRVIWFGINGRRRKLETTEICKSLF